MPSPTWETYPFLLALTTSCSRSVSRFSSLPKRTSSEQAFPWRGRHYSPERESAFPFRSGGYLPKWKSPLKKKGSPAARPLSCSQITCICGRPAAGSGPSQLPRRSGRRTFLTRPSTATGSPPPTGTTSATRESACMFPRTPLPAAPTARTSSTRERRTGRPTA